MAIQFLYPQYEVVRNADRCIACRVCERQCANEVHRYDPDRKRMVADESKCVNCHRCVTLCPTRALKIVKTGHTFRENGNWSGQAIQEVYRQAESGGVLLSSKLNTGSSIYGNTTALSVNCGCVVGGTSFAGGIGGIPQTFVGLLVIQLLENCMNMLGINAYVQQVCEGIIILLILWFDSYAQKRKAEAV